MTIKSLTLALHTPKSHTPLRHASHPPLAKGTTMTPAGLHHISLVTADLERSLAFYRNLLGFVQVERPPFKLAGAWLRFGASELHLILNPKGTFRATRSIDTDDTHFAIRVGDFEAAIAALIAKGFRDSGAAEDPMRVYVNRNSIAGYPQAYLCDPDGNIVEINAAAAKA